MLNAKLNELKVNGFVRIYKEEMNPQEVMNQLENLLDSNEYAWGWEENRSGEFVEILKIEE